MGNLDDIVFRSKRKFRNVLCRSVMMYDHNIVLAVAARPWRTVRDSEHGLHGHDHTGPDDGVDVLSQLQSGLPAVVVAQHTEAVAVAERAVFEESKRGEQFIKLKKYNDLLI